MRIELLLHITIQNVLCYTTHTCIFNIVYLLYCCRAWVYPGASNIVTNIEHRIEALTGLSMSYSEALQVISARMKGNAANILVGNMAFICIMDFTIYCMYMNL